MKKGVLTAIIIGMAIAVIGICFLQAHWIHHAYRLKDDQFQQQVHLALDETVNILEQKESLRFVKAHLSVTDTQYYDVKGNHMRHHLRRQVRDSSKKRLAIHDVRHEVRIKVDTDSSHHKDMTVFERSVDEDGKVTIVKRTMESAIEDRFSWIMEKAVKEFKELDDPLGHLMEGINLDSLIDQQLAAHGVDQPYEYAITMPENWRDPRWTSDGYVGANQALSIKYPLFNNAIVAKQYNLVLVFPEAKTAVWKELLGIVSLAIVLTLAIITIFWITIRKLIQQKKLSDIKSDFINNMTHELKTPLATVSLAVDSLTHPNVRGDDEQLEHFAAIIKKETDRMNKQVEQVMRTSLAERGSLELQPKELDVHDLIEEMASRGRMQLNGHGEISMALEATNFKIMGDEMHFGNVLSNLIDNAIKYSRNVPAIWIRTFNKDGELNIQVQDEGIGMDKETQSKAFDKFFRATTGNIHDVKGTGIGLSYVKAIVEKHKGTVSIQSKPGVGTTVTLKVPTWT